MVDQTTTQVAAADPRAEGHRAGRRHRGAGPIRRRLATRLVVLTGSSVLVMIAAIAALLFQQHTIARQYDDILATEVNEALTARRMQVEFKKQVQEWKNILLRGSDAEDLADYGGRFRKQDAMVRELAAALIRDTTDPGRRAQLLQFREQHEKLDAGYQASLAKFVASNGTDFKTSDRMVRGQDRPPTDLVDTIVAGIENSVADRISEQKFAVQLRERLAVGAALLLVLVIAVAVLVVVTGVVRPIRRLTAGARRAAHETLPSAIAQIKTMPADAEPPRLPAVEIDTGDELQELGEAFTEMQTSAVGLAVEQHRADREAAEVLINLGRRNQNLLGRTLSYITELERTEQDGEVLGKLFRLDHATTRIRRNAESMMVLAGAQHTRTWSRPLPIGDVVRAALSEIEEYARVDLHHLDEVALSGSTAADVVHLLAELIENATHFSPPSTRVTIVGQHVPEGYRVRVIDNGIGMTSRELAETNARVKAARDVRTDTSLLGLHVVGLLAARRGIEVELEPSAGRGITASVVLPKAILSTETDPGQAGIHPWSDHRPLISGDRAEPSPDGEPRDQGRAGAEQAPVIGHRTGNTYAWPEPAHATHGSDSPGLESEVPADSLWQPRRPAADGGYPHGEDSAPRPMRAERPGGADRPESGDRTSAGDRTGAADRESGGLPDLNGWQRPHGAESGRTPSRQESPLSAPGDVPRRIRGAQLPDLGPAAEPARDSIGRDAARVRGQLSALQAGVEAGRSGRTDHPTETRHPRPERSAAAEQIHAAPPWPSIGGSERRSGSSGWNLDAFLREVDAAQQKIGGVVPAQGERGDDLWRREES